jgi:hypothetical protein
VKLKTENKSELTIAANQQNSKKTIQKTPANKGTKTSKTPTSTI